MTKKDEWHILAWKDEAGRDDMMVGPLSALKDKVAELKKAGRDYDLTPFYYEEAKQASDTTAINVTDVAGKDMETR